MYRGNYLEYLEIGKNYIGAFSGEIKYRSITIVISFLWIFGLMYITNKIIQKAHATREHFTYYPSLPFKSPNF